MPSKIYLNSHEFDGKQHIFHMKIPSTDPKLPFINFVNNLKIIKTSENNELSEKTKLVFLLNNAMWLKAEFAKQSFRIIEACFKKYLVRKDGQLIIRLAAFYPALREIDALIFELGSILDFFAREINILLKLGIKLREISFTNVIQEFRKKYPDDPLTKTLTEFNSSDFHRYFRGMRNRITHRLPFVTRGRNGQYFFPDEPSSDDVIPIMKKEIDVLKTCREWLNAILTFVDQTSMLVLRKKLLKTVFDVKTDKELDIEELYRLGTL